MRQLKGLVKWIDLKPVRLGGTHYRPVSMWAGRGAPLVGGPMCPGQTPYPSWIPGVQHTRAQPKPEVPQPKYLPALSPCPSPSPLLPGSLPL